MSIFTPSNSTFPLPRKPVSIVTGILCSSSDMREGKGQKSPIFKLRLLPASLSHCLITPLSVQPISLLFLLLMCQFCGVDPAFAAFFENTQGVPQDPSVISVQTPAKPNFFRLKPKSKTMPTESKGLQEQQLKNFQTSLSSRARVITESDGSAYTDAIRRWSKCAIKPAKAVIMPTTAEDVSKIVCV